MFYDRLPAREARREQERLRRTDRRRLWLEKVRDFFTWPFTTPHVPSGIVGITIYITVAIIAIAALNGSMTGHSVLLSVMFALLVYALIFVLTRRAQRVEE